ncbi:formate dehydrogenase iron-sulfur subunit [Haloarcula vallismortis]|uniref:Formate dehydrogenase-O iron-sulfur subunit n=2 Tax=Haloarcula vallismortis TaxID=28442 RepID=M0JIX6_HALVA|nr:4Fe-4S dicluster domain-containing protein [Haloarcula vallismortis]EMA09062.1 formate dehydrogenase-O iron-sulfur subunit [Haloarcula vallismortis ATCC 29715]SDX10570.1 formate dehydrogenase iron-sulfur subunit [Haloarcula vallismortis]
MSTGNEVMHDGVMSTGEDARIFPDVEACIDCGGCVVSCKRTWDVPRDEQRISIATMLEGQEAASGLNASSGQAIGQGESPGETAVPMQCYHCENAPCVSVCPTDSLISKENGFVRVRDDLCIGCQYCLSACPFGAPQFPDEDSGVANLVGSGGNMDKCTMCEERQDVGKGPACAEECATDAILVGTPEQISDELDNRDSGTFFNDVAMDIIFGEDASEFQ